MCWLSKIKPIIRVADSDILVEKILVVRFRFDGMKRVSEGISSPIMLGNVWEIGEEYHCRLDEPFLSGLAEGYYEINSGFHSCREISKGRWYWKSVDCNGVARDMFDYYGDEYVYSAVIPSGSHYYVNEHGEYVSDRLRIIGKKDCVINNKIKLRYGKD